MVLIACKSKQSDRQCRPKSNYHEFNPGKMQLKLGHYPNPFGLSGNVPVQRFECILHIHIPVLTACFRICRLFAQQLSVSIRSSKASAG